MGGMGSPSEGLLRSSSLKPGSANLNKSSLGLTGPICHDPFGALNAVVVESFARDTVTPVRGAPVTASTTRPLTMPELSPTESSPSKTSLSLEELPHDEMSANKIAQEKRTASRRK